MTIKHLSIVSIASIATTLVLFSSNAYSQEVNISQDMPYIDVSHDGKSIRIQRIQDQENHLTGGFAKTSRKCPPFCIQPMNVAPGVTTIAELELIDFIQKDVTTGAGVLIDARTPSWHSKGTIPGSVNIPFTTFAKTADDQELIKAMEQLGVKRHSGDTGGVWSDFKDWAGIEKKPHPVWDFSSARKVALWCNGMWCGQSPRAIHGLLKHGYPAEKLYYYRSGMQSWQILGLTVVMPDGEVVVNDVVAAESASEKNSEQ